VARLVGEFAEVHLPRVTRLREHVDVRAGTEDPVLCAGDDDGADLGVFEADALHDVVQLDVDAQVVRVELRLVTRPDSRVFGDIHRDRRDTIRVRYTPVFISHRVDLVIDQLSCANHVRSNAARSRSL